MLENKVNFTIGDIIDQIKPEYLTLIFLITLGISVLISLALVYHFNKYRHHSPGTILAEIIYIAGLLGLLFLAFIFLILYSK